MDPDDYDDGTEYDEDYWESQYAKNMVPLGEANLYDIIVAVRLHAATVTVCPTQYLENFANATLLEAIPCGSPNFCDPLGIAMPHIQGVINRFRTDPLFIQKLRVALIGRRNRTIKIFKRTRQRHPLYESELFKNYRSVQTPWRVLEEGYMERRYTADDPLTEILVCYVARGPFTLGQNIYLTHPIKTRTELMELLQQSGYKKPLIIDYSCGNFAYELGMTAEDIKQKQRLAVELGVGGTKRKRRNRSRRIKRNGSNIK